MDAFIHYGLAASIQAIRDAGLPTNDAARRRGSAAHRLPDRLGHRRPAADRGHQGRAREARPAPDHAVLRAGVDHQHDLGPRLDHVRLPGPEPGDRHRLHDRAALDRHGRPDDRARRRRRHDRRRRRGDRLAARHRRLRRGAGAVDPQRRSRDRVAALGQGPRRLRPRRGRRRAGPRGVRAREAARRQDLRRADRLRHGRRRLPHDRAQRRRPEALDAGGAALGRRSTPTRSSTSTRTARRRRSATSTRPTRSSWPSATTRGSSSSTRPSR